LFYPADDEPCRAAAARLVHANDSHADAKRWIGGIVPHAGWIASGAIAGETIGTIARQFTRPDVVVIFGAVHTPLPLDAAVLSSAAEWLVPGGVSEVPEALSGKLESDSHVVAVDDRFHAREHAVEVELPLIQNAWPAAHVLPVEVPLIEDAVQVGIDTAKAARASGLSAIYLASSDLTHYGPDYGFAPAGIGVAALDWATDNDRRLLQVVTSAQAEAVVPHVRENLNACGGGAIAAMLAACREAGAVNVSVLRHANSYQVLRALGHDRPDNAVGYAAVVVG